MVNNYVTKSLFYVLKTVIAVCYVILSNSNFLLKKNVIDIL